MQKTSSLPTMKKGGDDSKLMSRTAPPIGNNGKTMLSSQSTPALDIYDHNNMNKTITKTHSRSGLLKTDQKPPVKMYPGTLKESKSGTLRGAVYAADIEREEAELLASMSTIKILSPEELLRNPDYKKLDQSKLPIEIFDNIEYEAIDKSPEEWLATGSMGKIPYCEDEKWIWKPVTVLGYDSTTKLYDVQYFPDGIRKTASRLNLLFDQENEKFFHERRSMAVAGRSEAKQIMRFDHFVSNMPADNIRAMSKEHIRKIQEKVVDGLSMDIPFPEPNTQIGNLLKNLTADTIKWYSYIMKKPFTCWAVWRNN